MTVFFTSGSLTGTTGSYQLTRRVSKRAKIGTVVFLKPVFDSGVISLVTLYKCKMATVFETTLAIDMSRLSVVY